ncbi:MAG TPA: ABC transporter ATP-binding protein, partial [Anaerolineales bacterium]|nr:ABC transporter ATP-binding protein [Anaerolineales bacterium]
VTIGDWDTRNVSVAKLASRVGYVFQNPDEQLFCRTVQDEVAFGPRNLRFDQPRIDSSVQDALQFTELGDKRETNPYDLSPTWRKMVALASIISMDTPVVIFDEPTTGQDAASVARIAHVVAELQKRGKTVITITHDIDFAAENFGRVIALSKGRILLDGPAGTVFAQEQALAETYVDPPQLTRLGSRLGFDHAVRNQNEFLQALEAR